MALLLACFLLLAIAGWALGRWPAKWQSRIAAFLLIALGLAIPISQTRSAARTSATDRPPQAQRTSLASSASARSLARDSGIVVRPPALGNALHVSTRSMSSSQGPVSQPDENFALTPTGGAGKGETRRRYGCVTESA